MAYAASTLAKIDSAVAPTATYIVFQSHLGYCVSNSSLLICLNVGWITQNGLNFSMSISCSSGLMDVSAIQ